MKYRKSIKMLIGIINTNYRLVSDLWTEAKTIFQEVYVKDIN